MGKLTCSRCGAEYIHEDLKHAVEYMDHSIGKTNGRPCPNDPKQYPIHWDGQVVQFEKDVPFVHKPKAERLETISEEKPTAKPKPKK